MHAITAPTLCCGRGLVERPQDLGTFASLLLRQQLTLSSRPEYRYRELAFVKNRRGKRADGVGVSQLWRLVADSVWLRGATRGRVCVCTMLPRERGSRLLIVEIGRCSEGVQSTEMHAMFHNSLAFG